MSASTLDVLPACLFAAWPGFNSWLMSEVPKELPMALMSDIGVLLIPFIGCFGDDLSFSLRPSDTARPTRLS
jgi:xanthine/uracil/vitamin C permease (AzgA family)